MKLDDIISVFKGDFLVMALEPGKTGSAKKSKVQIYFGGTVTSMESLAKLIAAIKKCGRS